MNIKISQFIFIKFIGWHWLIRLYRFQVYICVNSLMCIALHAHLLKSNHLPLFSFPFTTTHPLPSGNHQTVVCVYECQFYVPHMSEIIWFLAFSDQLVLPSMIFLRSIDVVTNGGVSFFSYGWVIFRSIYVPHLLYPSSVEGYLGYFHVLTTE